MSYWATGDAVFADGHYVEDWELERFGQLAHDLQAFIRTEAVQGNEIVGIASRTVFLSRPPSTGVLGLPEGLCFACPLQHNGTRVYDGDEDGVIVHMESRARVYPSGYESPHERPERLRPFPNDGA